MCTLQSKPMLKRKPQTRAWPFALGLSAKYLLSSLCLTLPLAAQAQQVDLGVAAHYAGFFFGNVSNVPDVEGRLALGGNLSIAHSSIGPKVAANATDASLVVGGNIVSFNGGSIGSSKTNNFAVYAGSKGSSAVVPTYLDLRHVDFSPIDFEAERTYLSVLSQQLSSRAATGSVSKLYSRVTLTGSNQDIEVFNLTADQVKSTLDIALANVKPSAYVILNVAADAQRSIKFGITMTVFNGRQSKVLVNMPDAELINFTHVGVLGSILAPYACVKNSSGHLEGTIIAASWDAGMEIGNSPFVASH
jgi:choice-of-anchor A domain-containing protein